MPTLFPSNHSYFQVSGSRVLGKWVPVETESVFSGSIQPARGKDLDFLPVGRKDKGSIKIYSSTILQSAEEGSDHSGDIVPWGGRRYEIVTAFPNQSDILSHYKYLAVDIGGVVV